MMHNFETEVEKTRCDPAIRECLLELYKAEEIGLRDSRNVPNIAYYENTINSYYEKFTSDQKGREVE